MSTASAPHADPRDSSSRSRREHGEAGGAWFVPAARLTDAAARLLAARYLVVPATEPAPEPGCLGQAIDDAVEGALAMRGALPPGVEVDADLRRSIRDRLMRVRALDRAGLAIAMPRLGRLADSEGRLDRADSEALVAWIAAARSGPIVFVLDERDRRVRALAPMAIEEIAPEIEPAVAVQPPQDLHGEETERPPLATLSALELSLPDDDDGPPSEDEDPTLGLDPPEEERPTPVFQIAVESFPEARAPAPPPEEPAPPAEPEPPPQIATPTARRAAERVISAAEWRSYAIELDAARGPKPARMIDKLFVTRYVPLLGAVARGEVDTAVRGVVDAWRTSFEHSYREGFPALRVTGKRPPMVFDAPDIAAKIGRLGGARSVKLLLVDSMSFDLGERVTARLAERLAGKALCVERQLLWSALPTTTPAQMALLARGQDGLRDPIPTSEREPDVARGRALTTLRRERIGSRELMKLDVVEARLRMAGPAYDDRLDLCAEEVTQIVARYAEGLAARTLLFVFGDHGFRMPLTLDGRSTGPATQGGPSPEEVLVPGYAWLVGGVH